MTSRSSALLVPERCAVVVVDMQNDYCHPEGALASTGADVSACASAAASVDRLLAAARAAGVPCLHARTEHSEWTDTAEWTARGDGGDLLDPRHHPIVRQGSWGAEPYVIHALPEDRILVKHRYSGFAYTPLELFLRARDRHVVVLAGVTSDICVRATGFDALTRGFSPVLVRDCTASTSSERHEAAVRDFAACLGPVVPFDEVESSWGRSGAAATAPLEATADQHEGAA